MKWAHLPVFGGMYDQDPMLWKYWDILWREEAKEAERDHKKRMAEMDAKKATSRQGSRVRRRR